MAIDTSMYGGLLQKPKSIAEYDAERLQLQQAQQQNRLADLVYGEKQREIGGDNALASLLAGGKSGADVSQGLAAAGYGSKSMAYTKALQEQKERDAKISGENATAEEKRLKSAQMRIDTAGQTFKFVKDSPTAENAYAAIDHLTRNGVYTEEQAAAHKAVIAADPSPGNVAKLADMAFRAALAAKDQLAKTETRNLGGTTDTLQIDPVSGKVVVVNSAKNTQSPDSVAAQATAQRGQDISARTAGARLAFDKEQASANQDAVMDPLAVRMVAQQYLAGDTSALQNFGRGAQGAANLNAVRLEISKQATAAGLNGADIAAKVAEFGGLKAGQRTAGTRSASIEIAANEAEQLAPLALAASQKVARSGFLPFGKAQIMFDTNTNDPNLRQFAMANTALANAYGQVMSRGGVATVADKEHARELLSTSFDQPSYAAAVQQLQAEIKAAQKAPQKAKADMSNAASGRTPAASTAGDIHAQAEAILRGSK